MLKVAPVYGVTMDSYSDAEGTMESILMPWGSIAAKLSLTDNSLSLPSFQAV